MMVNPDVEESNRRHDEVASSTFLRPHIRTLDDMIHYAQIKLGYPLQTVELTREHYEIALQEALELYTKFASFDVEDIVVSLERYDPKLGLDLSEYRIADIHDISFRRDAFLQMWGCDWFFGPYGMMNSYAGQGIFPGGNGAGLGNQGWVSLHNLHEFIEMANRVTGSSPQWRFFRNSQRLKITPTPKLKHPCKDNILITCECEPPVEELLGNEYVKKLFLAKCKIQLGDIRKKFQSVQLLGGGTLDTSIGEQGQVEWDKYTEELRQSEAYGNLCMLG
jgi:hypothetical protein